MRKLTFGFALASSLLASSVALAGDGPIAKKAPTPPAPTPAPVKPLPVPPAPSKPVADTKPMLPGQPNPAVAAMAKSIGGTWRCAGEAPGATGAMEPMKATLTNKLDTKLGKFWIESSFKQTGKKGGYAFTGHSTLIGSVWHRVMVDNMGGYERAEAKVEGAKVTWDSTSYSAMGTVKTRHIEEASGPRLITMWGEMTMDGGKTFMPMYKMTCKK